MSSKATSYVPRQMPDSVFEAWAKMRRLWHRQTRSVTRCANGFVS